MMIWARGKLYARSPPSKHWYAVVADEDDQHSDADDDHDYVGDDGEWCFFIVVVTIGASIYLYA